MSGAAVTDRAVVATIGAFDGVHRGHQLLLGQVVDRARGLGLASLCVTFDPHPDVVLYPDRRLTYLTGRADKEQLVRDVGLDEVLVFEFTRELSMLRPDEFLRLIRERQPLAELWVGSDFAIGRDRSGTIAAVAEIGRLEGFALHVVPPQKVDGQIISSTFIRQLLTDGDVRHANLLLGRPYRLSGPVGRGAGRGRQLGWPTANVQTDPQRTLPADGVYAARVAVDGRDWKAVANLGSRPTFEEAERLLEVHLLDFKGDLYGRELAVDFLDRVRDVRRFNSVDDLRTQIARDAESARNTLSGAS
jgi:riboflavin kinase/FMN adenylyltransferase